MYEYIICCSLFQNCSQKIFLNVVLYVFLQQLYMIYAVFSKFSQIGFPENGRDNFYRSDMQVQSVDVYWLCLYLKFCSWWIFFINSDFKNIALKYY